jgi:hypothetical protein
MEFQAKLVGADELEEWLPAYPGDPLAREAGVYVTMVTNDLEALDQWFDETLGDRARRHYPDDELLAVSWAALAIERRYDMKIVYFLKEKRDTMLVRLAWDV